MLEPMGFGALDRLLSRATTTGCSMSISETCARFLAARSHPSYWRSSRQRAWPQRREARTTRFCVRIGAVRPHDNRARRQRVHRIPRSTCRDDRPKRPSFERGGMPERTTLFRKTEAEYFSLEDWTAVMREVRAAFRNCASKIDVAGLYRRCHPVGPTMLLGSFASPNRSFGAPQEISATGKVSRRAKRVRVSSSSRRRKPWATGGRARANERHSTRGRGDWA